ncbi:MAG: radical SAM protein [Candidatus Omnitrophota bacterium]
MNNSFIQSIWKLNKDQILSRAARSPKDLVTPSGILVFIVTSRCNFRCRHCLRNFDDPKDLPLDLAQRILKEAKTFNYTTICLTGGEPLVYPYLEPLCEFMAQENLRFSIVTNGYLFKEHIDLLVKYRRQLLSVAFSLEHTNPQKHDAQRQKGSFDKLLEAFSLCRAHRIPFKIVCAIGTHNLDNIFDMALFGKRKGAVSMAMTTILPCPKSQDNSLVLNARQREELFTLLLGLPKIVKIPITIAADIKANNRFPLCNPVTLCEVAVDPDANIVHCCEMSNFDNVSIHKKAIIASLKEQSFGEALKKVSEHFHRFNCQRIDEYQKLTDPSQIDFTSCFYCVARLADRTA